MFKLRWLLIPLLGVLTLGMAVSAQDVEPQPPDEVDYFIAAEDAFSFGYPADWQVEVDSPGTYYLQSPTDDVSVLILLLPVTGERLITQFQDEQETAELPTPAQLLDVFFGQANYRPPQTLEIDAELERDAARISDDSEDIYTLYLSPPDTFALVFVQGDDRAEYEGSLLFILQTLRPGLPVIEEDETDPDSPVPDPAADADFPAGAESATLDIPAGGTIALAYPANWVYEDVGGGIGSLSNEDDSVFMLLVADLSVAFDLFGGQGDMDAIDSAESLIQAISAGDPDLNAAIVTDIAGLNETARIDVSDETSDDALIAVQTPDGRVILVLTSADSGTLTIFESLITGIISSIIAVE